MGDPYKRDRRLGRWFVSGRHPIGDADALLLQRDVIIRDVRSDHMNDRLEYVGQSEHFEIVPPGDVIPFYVPIVHVENHKPIRVTWAPASEAA